MKAYYVSLKTTEKPFPINVEVYAENQARAELIAKRSALQRMKLQNLEALEIVRCEDIRALIQSWANEKMRAS